MTNLVHCDPLAVIGDYSHSYCSVNRESDLMQNRSSYNVKGMELHTLQGRLKFARKKRKMSQGVLAAAAGISQPTYSDLERGVSHGSVKLGSIARALKVSINWLETGEGQWDAGDAGETFVADVSRSGTTAQYVEQMRRTVIDAAQTATPDQLLSVMSILIGSKRGPDNRHPPPIDEILKVVEKHSLDQSEYQKSVSLLTESISEIGKKLNNVVQFIERQQENKGGPGGKDRRNQK